MRNWAFDRKLRMFLLAVILPTTMVVLLASTWSSISSISQKSRSLMQIQLHSASDDIDARLGRYRDMAVAAMLDASIKRYLVAPALETIAMRNVRIDDARSALTSFCQVDSRIQFISVIRNWPGEYVFKGVPSAFFESNYERDLQASIPAGYGGMRISRSPVYSGKGVVLTAIYTPIYATMLPTQRTGDLCICVDDSLVTPIQSDPDPKIRFETCLVGTEDGRAISSSSADAELNQPYPHFARLEGDGGSFEADGSLHVYRKVGRWSFYLVGEMPLSALYGDSINVMVWLVALVLLFVGLSLGVGSRMVRRVYASLGLLSQGMEAVSHGELGVRLSEDGAGGDFQRIYAGFNDMAGRISGLLERVKAEEREMEQIRFNALQAQIHPHFLYNTLDCIRWMATAQGAGDIVRIVKALSQYYRLCLSQGRDVITLSEEVAFTNNYLTIQNIRYEGAIHCSFEIPPRLMNIRIPKITLQPLVENYINHGFVSTSENGMLRIVGGECGDDALIEVIDNGAGMTAEKIAEMNASLGAQGVGIGYGIRNVHHRIRLLFGAEYGLSYELNELGGVTARIRLPFGDG